MASSRFQVSRQEFIRQRVDAAISAFAGAISRPTGSIDPTETAIILNLTVMAHRHSDRARRPNVKIGKDATYVSPLTPSMISSSRQYTVAARCLSESSWRSCYRSAARGDGSGSLRTTVSKGGLYRNLQSRFSRIISVLSNYH
jgi:hypothetical protein